MAGARNRFVFTVTLDCSLITDEAKLIECLNESNFERILKARDHEGYSYLHLAAKANAYNAVRLLLDKGADPNARSSKQTNGQTPLHVAGGAGNEAVLQLMLNDHRADVRVLDTTGKSPLDYALKMKSKTMLDKLECYWSEDTLHHCQMFEVLNDALRTNQSAAILKLINKDERKDLITFQSYSNEPIALRSDTVLNSLELIQRVDYSQCEIPAVLTGCSVIHWACQHGQKDLILHFIKLIPDIMSHTSNEGYTPLHMLAIYNQVNILKELIRILRMQHLQSLSLSESTTAVPMTAGSDVMVMVAKETITLGDINFDVMTKTKHTPLHLAAAMGNVEFVDALVSHASFLDLNLDASDILGLTPLHLTLRVLPKENNEKWLNVVHMLLKSRVSVNTDALNPDSVGVYATPLAQVCGMQQFDLVELLGRHGAKDSKRSAINLCIKRGYPYKVMTSILSHVITMREDKYSVMWQNIQFPGDMNPDWVADALVSAHIAHHQLRSIELSVLPLIEASVTVVDLSSCGLHRLPIEVFYFPNLEVLSANKNKLEGLPLGDSTERALPEIPWKYSLLHSGWLCLKLRSLLLKENQLKTIPECVFQLPCLKTLDVSHNKLTELPSNMWIAPQLEELYCMDNDLVSLPSNDKLILSRSLVTAQSSEVEAIKSNRHASFIAERTTLIERKVLQLPAISESQRYLDVNMTGDKQRVFKSQVSVVRTSLSDKLEERLMVHHPDLLYLNDLSDSASTSSTGLRVLSLGKNDINALPVDFPCLCPNLRELDLSKNILTRVQFPYIFPDTLVHLNLAGNPLQQIDCMVEPPRVTFCTIPRASSESRTVTSIPNEPFHCDIHGSSRLSNLVRLRLVHCQLRTLNLYSHTNIVLANEDLVDHKFDPEARVDIVGGKIEQLNISSNLLKEVHSSIVHLTHLVTLNISHNPDIIQVPKELGRLRKLKEIHFDGLNLINPPMELLGKGTKSHDIIGYLSSLYLKAQPYHRLKLMLVGWENMGKTTLLRKLMEKGQRSEERNIFIKRLRPNNQGGSLSTVGISLRDWIYRRTAVVYNDIKQITFRTWDFGGQDEFYATHQIFLTPKAIYLAVWNVLHGRAGVERLKLWLLNINARVHRAAVIIVGTHVDMLSRDDQAKLHSDILKEINTFYKIPPYTPGAMHKARWNPPVGFPQVMASVVVSCKSGHGISQLRDIIYEVSTSLKEGGNEDSGPIANRARYVLTQLYPASYLWLEDKVRKMVMRYHSKHYPPVLTTQQFMDEIFTDVDNMFTGDSAVEDLDKAVRFLCASGTIVHQEDPVLADLYFIDPQWLCDMFAHVITIRSINGWIAKDSGIMMKDDLDRVFIDQEFPIKWKEEYIRLMTIFEVVVEIDHSQLLIPSHVKDESLQDPFLSLTKGLNCLPPLHHFLFLPHIPSGFWVRLISRILGDSSIVSMVTTGFGAKNVKNFFGRNLPFSWCLVKRGIMLKYEDFPVITVRELPGRQIFQLRNCHHVHYMDSESGQTWKKIENRNQTAIEVIVNDLYPLLVLEEVQYAYQKTDVEGLRQFPFVEFDTSVPSEEYRVSSPPQSSIGVVQPTLPIPPVCVVDGFNLETEIHITRNPRIRMHTRRKEVGKLGPVRLREIVPDDGIKEDTEHEEDIIPRSRTHNLLSFSKPKARNLEPAVQPAKRALSKRQMKTSVYKTGPEPDKPEAPPTLNEDVYDIKRAAVFAQILDHIRSIWEDWYPKLKSCFIRTDEEKVPCPFCWENRPSGRPRLARSFSSRSEISDGVKLLVKPDFECQFVVPPPPPATGPPNPKEVQSDIVGVDPPLWEEPNHYMFNFFHYLDVCPHLSVCFCPRHHTIPSQYVIPNMTFQSVSCDIIADPKDLHHLEYIDTGNFAEVEKRKWVRKRGEQTVTSEVAMKVMKTSSERVKYHITLEKEMTVINDLDHPNIIKCLGIVLHPLAAILELAPMGNLRTIYLEYLNEDLLIPLRVVHKTLIDVTSAVQYLHSRNIIYHDLKASNVLVWRYMSPGQQLAQDDHSILGDEVVHVKLADFNISVVVPLVEKIHHLRGTPGFIAPELANYKHGLYTNKVDMFSLGSFIYELITCQRPYEKEDPGVMYKGCRPHLYKKHRVFPVLLLELMYWCWEMRVDIRPSASDVLRALLSDQCLRLLMGINIHNKMYPKSVALWWGKPCNQGDSGESLPQQSSSSNTAQTPIHRLWVACSDFYSSCLTILDWEKGHFTAVQDISSGASSVLCMKTVGDSVWVGFEHGYLMVYDAATKCPKAQLWPKGRAMVVQTIAHIPSLKMVYLGFGNGFVWAVSDNLVSKDTNVMVTGPLTPLAEFDDLTKTISAILPVPVGGANQYELWVGQNDQTIVILDPKRSGNAEDSSHTLEVKEYITITHDMSTLPQYLSDSFVSHLVLEELSLGDKPSPSDGQTSFLYSALFSGQVVSRWAVNSRKCVSSYDIVTCDSIQCTKESGPWITSLHSNSQHIYIGLTSGDIIILRTGTLMELTTLSCHHQQVKCLITMPTPAGKKEHSSSSKLVSCGLGFKSYYDPKPVDPAYKTLPEALEPAKLLLWNVANI